MGRRTSSRACHTCRERHKKCDQSSIPCANCTKSRTQCVPSSRFLFRPVSKAVSGRKEKKNNSEKQISRQNHSQEGPSRSAGGEGTQIEFVHETFDTTITPLSVADGHMNNVSRTRRRSKPQHLIRSQTEHTATPTTELAHLSPAEGQENQSHTSEPIETSQNASPRLWQDAAFTSRDWTADEIFTNFAHIHPSGSTHQHHDLLAVLERQNYRPNYVSGDEPNPTRLTSDQANLVRYFTQIWGPLIDATDHTKQFSTSVPHLACTESPSLLYAILALVSLQLSRISDYPSNVSEIYRRECARILVPILLADRNNVHEASIFATYVLLRVYDHLSADLFDRSPESLFSDGLALSTQPWNAYSQQASLKRAAFWVHLRQDIHIALMLECPVRVDHALYEPTVAIANRITEEDLDTRVRSGHPQTDGQSASPEDYSSTSGTSPAVGQLSIQVECAWANRIVGLTCRILNYCYGSSARTYQAWTSLMVELESWNVGKPRTFHPFHESMPEPGKGLHFPKIWLQNDWHVIGMLYYHLSMVLIKSYRPDQVCRNKDLMSISYDRREEILCHLRSLCGLTLTNPIPQALLIVVPMLNAVAGFFPDAGSQESVIELLQLAKKITGSPSETVVTRLRQGWNR